MGIDAYDYGVTDGHAMGVEEVLVNLAEFIGQGGQIDSTNVDDWIATYSKENDK
jgi:hypothetical protein